MMCDKTLKEFLENLGWKDVIAETKVKGYTKSKPREVVTRVKFCEFTCPTCGETYQAVKANDLMRANVGGCKCGWKPFLDKAV